MEWVDLKSIKNPVIFPSHTWSADAHWSWWLLGSVRAETEFLRWARNPSQPWCPQQFAALIHSLAMAWSGCEHAASGQARYEISGNPDGHSPSIGSAFLVLFQRVVARGKERLHREQGAGVPAMICDCPPQRAQCKFSLAMLIRSFLKKIMTHISFIPYKVSPCR